MADVIGAVQVVNLEVNKGSALSFDMEWWDDSKPPLPIPISAINVRMTINDVRYDLDELGYATISAANVISVALPGNWTSTLPAKDGRWRMAATDAISGEERVLARGSVRVRS